MRNELDEGKISLYVAHAPLSYPESLWYFAVILTANVKGLF